MISIYDCSSLGTTFINDFIIELSHQVLRYFVAFSCWWWLFLLNFGCCVYFFLSDRFLEFGKGCIIMYFSEPSTFEAYSLITRVVYREYFALFSSGYKLRRTFVIEILMSCCYPWKHAWNMYLFIFFFHVTLRDWTAKNISENENKLLQMSIWYFLICSSILFVMRMVSKLNL